LPCRHDLIHTVWGIKEGYNDKSLTIYPDKLVAISGLAREYQLISGDSFIAGLWKRKLLQELL
jgi:hypothetical protein